MSEKLDFEHFRTEELQAEIDRREQLLREAEPRHRGDSIRNSQVTLQVGEYQRLGQCIVNAMGYILGTANQDIHQVLFNIQDDDLISLLKQWKTLSNDPII